MGVMTGYADTAEVEAALDLAKTALQASLKGANEGVAELDASGKVPAGQLPSYVDDVIEYADFASFPASGETSKIYVAVDTSKVYRWSGSAYIEISPLPANVAKLDAVQAFTAKQTFSGGYNESGSTLSQSGGNLTIPLDGKTYKVVPSEAITSISVAAPTAPLCSGCTVYFMQGTTGYSVSLPATWYWNDGVEGEIETMANATTRLTLTTDPDGNVHADTELRAVA